MRSEAATATHPNQPNTRSQGAIPDANALYGDMRGKMRSHHRMAALAGKQHGVVGRGQLLALGWSEDTIERACESGQLHRLHRGAYAVGHVSLSDHGRCLAAVISCGPRALLSGSSAAWLWDLISPCPKIVDVTVPARGHRRRGLRLHHAPAINAADRAMRAGIPVTAIPRTLLDIAASDRPARLERAIERSEQLELFDLRAVEALLGRTRGHHGQGPLKRALVTYQEPAFTRSRLEKRFLRLVRETKLPRPSTNVFIAGFELDAYWPEERFAVELDTYDFHGGHAAFERDRKRQEDLKLAGIEMTRITGTRISREPRNVANRLQALLAQRRRDLRRSPHPP